VEQFAFNSMAGFLSVMRGNAVRIWNSNNTDFVAMSHDGTDFNFAFTNTLDANFTGLTRFKIGAASLYISEKAAAGDDFGGLGQLWVKNTNPTQLWFTDDLGNDTQIV
ncbi:hypothetical protein LCGC14_2428220, partial [marine sediment metagenome]